LLFLLNSGYELDVPTWDKYKEAKETVEAIQKGPKQALSDANTDEVLEKFP